MDDLPPWVLWGVPIGIVILALVASKSSGGGAAYGAVTAYQPTPADPGLVALAQSEVAAKSQAFGTLASIFGSEEISRISASRDEAISTVQAGVENARTEAARQAALAQQDTLRFVGKTQSDNETALGIEQARQAAAINKTNVAGATSQAHIAAKESGFESVVGFGKAVVNKLNPFHWF